MLDRKKLFILREKLIEVFEREYRKYPIYIVQDGIKKINRVQSIDDLMHKSGVLDSFLDNQPIALMDAKPGTKVRARKQKKDHISFMVATVPGIDYLKEAEIYTISGVYIADCFHVLQLEEFPGLTFQPDCFELLDRTIVTEDNIREMYGEDFDADMNEKSSLFRKMKRRFSCRKSPECELFLVNDDLSLTELECDQKTYSRR